MPEQKPAAGCPETPDGELIRLRVLTAEQAAQIAQLLQRIQELEARLALADQVSPSKNLYSRPVPPGSTGYVFR